MGEKRIIMEAFLKRERTTLKFMLSLCVFSYIRFFPLDCLFMQFHNPHPFPGRLFSKEWPQKLLLSYVFFGIMTMPFPWEKEGRRLYISLNLSELVMVLIAKICWKWCYGTSMERRCSAHLILLEHLKCSFQDTPSWNLHGDAPVGSPSCASLHVIPGQVSYD